jgi:hypothetical protein
MVARVAAWHHNMKQTCYRSLPTTQTQTQTRTRTRTRTRRKVPRRVRSRVRTRHGPTKCPSASCQKRCSPQMSLPVERERTARAGLRTATSAAVVATDATDLRQNEAVRPRRVKRTQHAQGHQQTEAALARLTPLRRRPFPVTEDAGETRKRRIFRLPYIWRKGVFRHICTCAKNNLCMQCFDVASACRARESTGKSADDDSARSDPERTWGLTTVNPGWPEASCRCLSSAGRPTGRGCETLSRFW